jgi:F0F1-type ATP synthase delta subunit
VRDTTLARNYAEALFELGERHHAHEEFVRSVAMLDTLLGADRRIRQFL